MMTRSKRTPPQKVDEFIGLIPEAETKREIKQQEKATLQKFGADLHDKKKKWTLNDLLDKYGHIMGPKEIVEEFNRAWGVMAAPDNVSLEKI